MNKVNPFYDLVFHMVALFFLVVSWILIDSGNLMAFLTTFLGVAMLTSRWVDILNTRKKKK